MQVFGVSFDGVEANRAFAEKHGFPYRLLSDPSRAMGLAYRACERADDAYARRITYVLDPAGRIEQALETRDPATQADSLLASLPPGS